jgi:hypothetical protein
MIKLKKKNKWQKNKLCSSFHCIYNSILDPLKKKEAENLSIIHSSIVSYQ